MSKWIHFKKGIIQELPLQIGVFPFGVIYGFIAIENGFSILQAFFMSSIIFAGASQIAFAKLYLFVSPFTIITSITAINLRHLLYGVSINEYLKTLSLKWRIILSYLLTDEAYAVSINYLKKSNDKQNAHYHFLGSGLTLFLTWQVSTLIGIFFGDQLTRFVNLEFIIPLSFIAIITPMLKNKVDIIACLISGISSLIFYKLNLELWIVIAALLGISISYLFILTEKKK